MGLIDSFRILIALMILYLLFVCLNYVRSQNGKTLEETLAGFNSDDVKTTLKRLLYFEMIIPFFQILQKSLPVPLLLCHTQ